MLVLVLVFFCLVFLNSRRQKNGAQECGLATKKKHKTSQSYKDVFFSPVAIRALESFMVFTAAYAVCGNSFPAGRWSLWLLAVVTVAHLLLEQPRWQLGLLYAQVMHLLYSAATRGEARSSSSWKFIALSEVAILFSFVLACILLPIPEFPALGGRFQTVGVVQRFLPTNMSSSKHQYPVIGVQVFYPSALAAPTRTGAQFLSAPVSSALAKTFDMPNVLFSHMHLATIRALSEAPVAPRQAFVKFPVIFLSHGLAGASGMYAIQACELASHGYVVFVPTHNDGSACLAELPANKAVSYTEGLALRNAETILARQSQLIVRVEEINLLIDTMIASESDSGSGSGWPVSVPFAGRLDIERLGVVGHSFGGATAVVVAHHDKSLARVKALVTQDVWLDPIQPHVLQDATAIPTLHVLSQQWAEWEENMTPLRQFATAAAAAANPNTRMIVFPGTRHSNYADIPLFSPMLSRQFDAIGSHDFVAALADINAAQVEFLDEHVAERKKEHRRLRVHV